MQKGKNIAVEFNEFSKNYSDDMIGCVPHYLKLISSFVENLPKDFIPKSILDLGCGNGNITANLIPHFPNATYTLVDASAEMINLCRNQFIGYDCIFHNSYFKDFTFIEDNYDLIVAGFSLHHCTDKEKQSVFKSIKTSLSKNGIFAYSDLMISKTNPEHPRLLKQWNNFVTISFPDGDKWSWLMDHYATYDRPTDYTLQIEWMKNTGFSKIRIPFKEDFWVHLQAIK